jgi:hypothetical protein
LAIIMPARLSSWNPKMRVGTIESAGQISSKTRPAHLNGSMSWREVRRAPVGRTSDSMVT